MNIALWVLQIVLGLAFLMAGVLKLTQPIDNLAKQMKWVTAVPAAMVRFIGLVELVGAIGLVLPAATGIAPWLTPVAAIGLALVMLMAAAFHVQRSELNQIAPSLVLFVLVAIIVLGRFVIAPL